MAVTPEELQALHHWMREPDWAENFSLEDIADWMNRRPTSITHQLAADAHGAHWGKKYRKAVDDLNRMNDKGELPAPVTNGER